MRMQYGPWWINIAVSAMFLSLPASVFAGTMQEGQAAGTAAGQTVQSLFGSKIGFNANISQPLTNADTPLKTIDGTRSFSANLATPSTNKFLELLIQPSSTGDLGLATFSADLNADGSFDHVYQVPRTVSGVCGNGYISCTPGTWSGCTPYRWTADISGQLASIETNVTDLGGCYCINASCGSSLAWNNSGVILKDLAGGAVAAIQKANLNFMVTNVSLTPISISYYGRIADQGTFAALPTTLPPPAHTKSYFTNPSELSTSVNDLILSSESDQDSLFSLLKNSASMQNAIGTQSSCFVTRMGSISTTQKTGTIESTGHTATDHYIYIRMTKASDTRILLETVDTGMGGYPAQAHWSNCDGVMPAWNVLKVIDLPASANTQSKLTAATWTIPVLWGSGCSTGVGAVDGVLNGFGTPIQTTLACGAKGCQGVNITSTFYYEYSLDTYSEAVSDTCAALAADPTCRLKEEDVDGVTTVRNFNRTGLQPLPTCRDFPGQTGVMNKCAEWWDKKRTYLCTSTSQFDFGAIGKRFGALQSSLSAADGSVTFTDTLMNPDGTWETTPDRSLGIIHTAPGSECEKACKTKVPKEDNEVTVTGTASDSRVNNTNAYDFLYKMCIGDTCPLEHPGETVVTGCACGSSFAEAAAAIQTMRLAGKDTICTSGERKPLETKTPLP